MVRSDPGQGVDGAISDCIPLEYERAVPESFDGMPEAWALGVIEGEIVFELVLIRHHATSFRLVQIGRGGTGST